MIWSLCLKCSMWHMSCCSRSKASCFEQTAATMDQLDLIWDSDAVARYKLPGMESGSFRGPFLAGQGPSINATVTFIALSSSHYVNTI